MPSKKSICPFLVIIIAVAAAVFFLAQPEPIAETPQPQTAEPSQKSPYVGEETRTIKTLSKQDTEGLLAGVGTPFGGMAKAAELNGYPGPRHVLDAHLAGNLELTTQQKDQIEKLYEEMKTQAINLGKQIIDIETQLDKFFKEKTINQDLLERAVAESTDAYSKLRVVHLSYHLKMVEILTAEQIASYNEARGYNQEDPCDNIPEGHDADMWRLHNNCE